MKKLLYIATRYPFPVKGGREKMIEQFLRFCSEEFKIYFAFFSKKDINVPQDILSNYNIVSYYHFNFPNLLEILKNNLIRRNTSLQERIFYSKKTQNQIDKLIKDIKPDIVIADMIRTAQFIEDKNVKKILDMDDLLSVRYKRSTYENVELLGSFSDIFPPTINKLFNSFIKKPILKFESQKIEKREIELSKKFDKVLLVSPKETANLESKDISNVFNFPPAVDIKKNIYNPDIQVNNFLFIGNMKTPQNLLSMKLIVDKILPILDKKIDFKLKIVGLYDKKLKEIVKPYKDKIELLGFVENLEEVIKTSKLLLSPIAFGTGIKTKILDAMSYGLPVFTNTLGIEGLNVKNLNHCVIEDDPEKLAKLMIDIINNRAFMQKLSKKGFEYVNCYHNPKEIKKKLLYILNSLL